MLAQNIINSLNQDFSHYFEVNKKFLKLLTKS